MKTRSVYDGDGNLSEVVYAADTIGAATYAYQFDNYGNRTKVIDARGKITKFEYDEFSRLIKRVLVNQKSEK